GCGGHRHVYRKMERASLSRYAFHPHGAAHETYQARADGESEAGAALSSCVGSVGLNKGVEDEALPLRRASHAGIGNRDVHLETMLLFLRIHYCQGHLTRFGELNGIAQQVYYD